MRILTLLPSLVPLLLGLVLSSALMLYALVLLPAAIQARSLGTAGRRWWTLVAGAWSIFSTLTLLSMRENIGTLWDMVPEEETIVALLLGGVFTGISLVVVAILRR